MSDIRVVFSVRFVVRIVVWIAMALIVAAVPVYLETFWLQLGLFICVAVIGAVGLDLLTGLAGQLSLAHAFFIGVGAYAYAILAAQPEDGSWGMGLPPLIAAVLAVAITASAGVLFSPVAKRLRGLYLGIATLGLVFIGQFVMLNASPLTGGTSGRRTPEFTVFGWSFSSGDPAFSLLGVPFERLERLWLLGVVLAVGSVWVARNLRDSRFGRQLQNIRDSEVAAAVLGVNVQRTKAAVFTVSSAYAGVAGVLLALTYEQVVPDAFGLDMSITYTVIIVIGGMGSVTGAALGAIVVTAIPQLLDHFSSVLPFVADTDTQSAFGPTYVSNLIYALLVVAILVFQPRGLSGMLHGLRDWAEVPSRSGNASETPEIVDGAEKNDGRRAQDERDRSRL
ncbi:branched-chain amino acid ABC transporter permease [Microbacterium soli]|uniref:Branched-chain amino acid ABC transporter permease n=1 Tax=Microbacterium soli TaxID=446075 RepID=A0ABP7MV72_9MICO